MDIQTKALFVKLSNAIADKSATSALINVELAREVYRYILDNHEIHSIFTKAGRHYIVATGKKDICFDWTFSPQANGKTHVRVAFSK